jgi:hypothetical protein
MKKLKIRRKNFPRINQSLFVAFFLIIGFSAKSQNTNINRPSFIFKNIIDKRQITINDGSVFKDSKSIKSFFKVSENFDNELISHLNTQAKINKIEPYVLSLQIDSLIFKELSFVGNIVEGTMVFEGQVLEISENPKVILPFKYYLKYKRSLNTTANLNKIFFEKADDIKLKTNKWFNENYGKNLNLVKHIKIQIVDFTPNHSIEDTLYYFQRKLDFKDFITKPKKQLDIQHDSYKMAILSTFNYQFETSISQDSLIVKLFSKVYQVKNKSIISEFEKSEYNLKYLQSYFDMAQMMAEKFKYSIRKEKFNLDTYKSAIDNIYTDLFTEFMEMKDEYETRTDNGFDHEEQEKWHKKIIDKLEEYRQK